jgi:U3 small nucleolar RNA-associated protein 20
MGIVFNSFGKIMAQIQSRKDDCLQYAHVVLLPLYKVSEGFARKVIAGIFSFPLLNFLNFLYVR